MRALIRFSRLMHDVMCASEARINFAPVIRGRGRILLPRSESRGSWEFFENYGREGRLLSLRLN